MNFDANTLVVSGEDNRVGIGTASPQAPFHITSSINNANGNLFVEGINPDIVFNDTNGGFNTFTFKNNSVNRVALGRRSDNAFYITMNNGTWDDNAFTIKNSNSNVGIGVNSGTQKLDVGGSVRVRTLGTGVSADQIVVADTDGVLKKRTVNDVLSGNVDDADANPDNETISDFSVENDGTQDVLRITEAGDNFDVPLTDITAGVNTDNQALSLETSNILTLEDGGTVDLSGYLDNTDNQNIDSLGLSGNILTVGIENGTAQTVDLSTLNNSGTDNQNLIGATLNGSNVLQIDIEDGNSATVDLSALNNSGTDNQNIEDLLVNTTTNVLTVGIEDGTAQTVDLSHLDDSGTDDQDADEVAIDDTANNFSATNVEGALAELASVSGDNIYTVNGTLSGDRSVTQNNFDLNFDGSTLVVSGDDNFVGIGTTSPRTKLDVTAVNPVIQLTDSNGAGATGQAFGGSIRFATNEATPVIGGYLTLTSFTRELKLGTNNYGDLWLQPDGQNVAIGLNASPSAKLDVNGDVRVRSLTSGASSNNVVSANANGVLEIAGTVDSFATDAELAALDTDDADADATNEIQDANEVAIADTAGNFTATEVEGALAELAVVSGDNVYSVDGALADNRAVTQNNFDLNFDANTLVVSGDDNRVGIGTASPEYILDLNASGESRGLGVFFNDKTTYDAAAFDTYDRIVSGMEYNWYNSKWRVGATRGASTNIGSFLFAREADEMFMLGSNGQAQLHKYGSGTFDTNSPERLLGVSSLGEIVEVEVADTDDQNIENLGLSGNILTVGIENGTAQNVDLSALDDSGTDNQNLNGATLNTSNVLQIDIEDGSSTTVDLSALDDSGTDNQNLTGATLNGSSVLQIDIEEGSSTTVDLSALDDSGTDNQNLTGATLNGSNVLKIDIEDGSSTTVDLSALNDSGTDNQNIEDLAVDTTTNILTVGIENGTAQTVNLSHLDDSGTDDQDAEEVAIDDTANNFSATSVEGALAELASVSGDNIYTVNGTLSGNRSVTQNNFDLKFDGSTLVVSGDDNSVGIGTASPQSKLDVTAVNPVIQLTDSNGVGATGLSFGGSIRFATNEATPVIGGYLTLASSSRELKLGTNNYGDLWLQPDGKDVAIGLNANPTAKLDVNGDVRVRSLISGASSNNVVSANANGVLEIAGTVDSFATDAELAALNTDDADADATNEIQDADEVAIDDTAGNFTATDVEGALAELAAPSYPSVNTKTTGYTLTAGDNGSVLTFDSATDVVLTVPSGLPIGFNVSVYQLGDGTVTFTASGTTLKNRLSRFTTAGKDAGAGVVATGTDSFHITGDLKL